MQTGPGLISEELRGRFAEAARVLVLTGAGVSAESGVPTFRGGGGTDVWKGLPFYIISSAEMLERDLGEVWAWFDYRRRLLQRLEPNPAHTALAKWQARFKDFTLVTQNIDGLHQAAGSTEVIELHGSIHRARCMGCAVPYDLNELDEAERPPACSECGNYLRPDVVLFGELIPMRAFGLAQAKAEACDLCFVVGTSAVVYPAAALPEIARNSGAYVVEVNPEATALSGICHERLQGKAGEMLPLLGEKVKSKW